MPRSGSGPASELRCHVQCGSANLSSWHPARCHMHLQCMYSECISPTLQWLVCGSNSVVQVAPYYQRSMVAALEGAERSPRVLGLTASFINGALKEMEKKRAKLETLLQSNLICPPVAAHLESDRFIRVTWVHGGNLANQTDVIEARVRELIKFVSTRPTGPVQEVKKVVSRCTHVFEELGSAALYFYIESVIVQQVS